VVLPESVLLLGYPRGLGGLYGLLPQVGEVPPLYPERSVFHVPFYQLRFHLTGELAAERSLVVGVLGQDDRRILVAQRWVFEVYRSLLFTSRRFVFRGRFGTLLRVRAAAGDSEDGEQNEACAEQPVSHSPSRMAHYQTFDVAQRYLTVSS
jgi:hypothetical protein